MLENGQLIAGRYRIGRQIGAGGMNNVYLCRDEKSGREWCVKEAKKASSEERKLLRAEAGIMQRLNHPALPSIIDVIDNENMFLIIEEYIPGEDLKAKLKKAKEPFAEYDIITWGRALAEVLSYLHSQRPPIIYRDLKPANVIIRPDGSVAIVDFGTAREYKEENRDDTVLLGTRGYAAPEQYGGQGQSDGRTDIYTLGATLFHLATGRQPQDAPSEFPYARKLNPAISQALEDLIVKCTQTSPSQRYQNCGEVIAAFDAMKKKKPAARQTGGADFGIFAALLFAGAFLITLFFVRGEVLFLGIGVVAACAAVFWAVFKGIFKKQAGPQPEAATSAGGSAAGEGGFGGGTPGTSGFGGSGSFAGSSTLDGSSSLGSSSLGSSSLGSSSLNSSSLKGAGKAGTSSGPLKGGQGGTRRPGEAAKPGIKIVDEIYLPASNRIIS